MQTEISSKIFDLLRKTDTCTISNVIETFNVRMRNDGFIHDVARCLFPELPPVAGYAVTGRLRASAPPIAGLCYYQRMDWWEYVASIPGPKVVAIEDADRIPGIGALFGEIHTRIARQLGCVAYVTNGTVRDVEQVRSAGFQCFARGISVSHSYAHVVDFGEPIEIGGLKISPGDLLHGDANGVQIVPRQVSGELEERVAALVSREAKLLELVRSPDFSLDKLAVMLNQEPHLYPPLHDA